MARHNFTALEASYPVVINQMPAVFTAHQFILKLAEQNQPQYIDALQAYRGSHGPVKVVHKQLTDRLYNFPRLVRRHGNQPRSRDIWNNSQACSQWQRLPGQAGQVPAQADEHGAP